MLQPFQDTDVWQYAAACLRQQIEAVHPSLCQPACPSILLTIKHSHQHQLGTVILKSVRLDNSDPSAAMEDREPSVDDVRKWNSTFYPESLAESSDKIRLLHIHAGEFAAPIQCSLSTETLQTPPELTYDALSYCWGDKPHSSPISVNGRADFMVSANLLAALQRMRYSDATHTVWVDYLCINQSDLAERGQQVELMGRIYENAQVVLCWLGPCGSTPSGHEELEFCDDHRLLKISEDDLPEAWVSNPLATHRLRYKSPWFHVTQGTEGSADRW